MPRERISERKVPHGRLAPSTLLFNSALLILATKRMHKTFLNLVLFMKKLFT